MASLSDIQRVIEEGNRKLKEETSNDIEKKICAMIQTSIDVKLKQHEEKLIGEIRALQQRTSALDTQMSSAQSSPVPVATKRARSEPPA